MKKIAILIAFLCISLFLHAQSGTLSWYKMIKGRIDKYPVTLHLHKKANSYSGYYYYDNQQRPLSFSGDDTSTRSKIRLSAFGYGEDMESFVFALLDDSVSGEWKKDENSKPLVFSGKAVRQPVNFTYVYTEGTVKLMPSLGDSPEGSYESGSVWPLTKTPLDQFIKKTILESFGEKKGYAGEEIGSVLLRHKKSFLSDYREQHKEVTADDLKEYAMAYNHEQSTQQLVAFSSPRMLSLAYNSFSYTGGAHGMFGTFYSSLDLVNRKKLRLEHVLTASGIKLLPGLLEKAFRAQYGVKQDETLKDAGLFENKIEPSNFYVTEKGITFAYTPYEIGPYVMGQIELYIPFSQLSSHIQPGFRSLQGK
ncbi:MAG TPA: DUF3298 domain-containing protein [Flavisolibacter sp.]|nr:DUF3298 domain-containing protein [Flavisolibacter sp.]